jgi:hypothetical protein
MRARSDPEALPAVRNRREQLESQDERVAVEVPPYAVETEIRVDPARTALVVIDICIHDTAASARPPVCERPAPALRFRDDERALARRGRRRASVVGVPTASPGQVGSSAPACSAAM